MRQRIVILSFALGAAMIVGCANQRPEPARAPMISTATTATTQLAIASATEPATETTTEPTTEAATEPTSEPSTEPSTEPTTRRSGASTASAQPAYWLRKPPLYAIPANDFESLWRACEASARHFGFVLDRLDYRGGVITTLPLTSKQFWEFWRNDVVTLEDLANSSLSTYRRTIRFDIEKTDEGGYLASPRVVIERFVRGEQPIIASNQLRNAFRSQRGSRTWGTRETDRGINLPRQYWYATGRDEALEKQVADEMRKQLAKAQRGKSG